MHGTKAILHARLSSWGLCMTVSAVYCGGPLKAQRLFGYKLAVPIPRNRNQTYNISSQRIYTTVKLHASVKVPPHPFSDPSTADIRTTRHSD